MGILLAITTKAKVQKMIEYGHRVLKEARNGKYNAQTLEKTIDIMKELKETLDGIPDFEESKNEATKLYSELCSVKK
ncbi:MAG: hypothetical protein QW751_02115 [Candidatus Aenigmatarchaeota archaeon]|nr:hypothetical protein [Candidatus Aenigmarchaeota archaeon]